MLLHQHVELVPNQPTNQPEHESDDLAGDMVTSVCVTNEKDSAANLINICHCIVVQ